MADPTIDKTSGITELKNCIDKKSCRSYEALFMDDNTIRICGYDGEAIEQYDNIVEASARYMFF